MGKLFRGGSDLLTSRPRRRLLLGALITAGALGGAPVARAVPAPSTYVWSGGAGVNNASWLSPANWSGHVAPSPGVTAGFDFFTDPCATTCLSTLDGAFTAQPLTLADDQSLQLEPDSGGSLTLAPNGAGTGLSAAPDGGPGGGVTLYGPITLASSQSWNIAGAGFGAGTETSVQIAGTVSGPGDALTVGLSAGANLTLANGATLGSLAINGTPSSNGAGLALDNGSVTLGATISAPGGTTINDAAVDLGPGTTGPLTLHGSLATFQPSSGTETTNGALTLDSTDETTMLIGADATPVAETATGNIAVGGQLNVSVLSGSSGVCPAIATGATYTLLKSTAGNVTGTFSDDTGAPIPDGGVALSSNSCSATAGAPAAPRTYAFRIRYLGQSVTATAIPASSTSLAASTKLLATNQSETLTATVSQTSGTPGGTLAFSSSSLAGASVLPGCGAVPVAAGGTATCTTDALAADPGTYYLQAAYIPSDPDVAGSTSQLPTLVKVTTGSTTTALSVDHATTTTAAPVTYTARVTPADAGPNAPTGEVAFTEGGSPASCTQSTTGQTAVSGTGVATCTVAYTATGPHTVTATYQGDEDFDGSTSSPTTVAETTKTAPVTITGAPTTAPKAGTGASTVASPVFKPGSRAVTVGLKCAAGGASCTVTVRLTATQTVTVTRGRKVTRTVVLGAKTTTLAAGKSARLTVALNRKGRVLLAKNTHLTAKVSVLSKTADGTTKTTARKITLRAARPAKPHRT